MNTTGNSDVILFVKKNTCDVLTGFEFSSLSPRHPQWRLSLLCPLQFRTKTLKKPDILPQLEWDNLRREFENIVMSEKKKERVERRLYCKLYANWTVVVVVLTWAMIILTLPVRYSSNLSLPFGIFFSAVTVYPNCIVIWLAATTNVHNALHLRIAIYLCFSLQQPEWGSRHRKKRCLVAVESYWCDLTLRLLLVSLLRVTSFKL